MTRFSFLFRNLLESSVALSLALILPLNVQAQDYRIIDQDEEIVEYFSGHTLKGLEITSGEEWAEFYDPTGKVCYQVSDYYAAGKWLVTDGQVCFRYQDSEGITCYEVLERNDQTFMRYASGELTGEVGFVVTERSEGNSEHLGLEKACAGGGA
jgi:hypothetical protein